MDQPTIEELEAGVKHLQELLSAAQHALHEAKVAASGVKVGDIVTHLGKVFKVAEIDPSWGGKPWVKGFQRLKNGSWGKLPRPLYSSWEHPPTSTDAEDGSAKKERLD